MLNKMRRFAHTTSTQWMLLSALIERSFNEWSTKKRRIARCGRSTPHSKRIPPHHQHILCAVLIAQRNNCHWKNTPYVPFYALSSKFFLRSMTQPNVHNQMLLANLIQLKLKGNIPVKFIKYNHSYHSKISDLENLQINLKSLISTSN